MLKDYLNESLTSKVYRIEPYKSFCNTILDNKFYTSLAELVVGEQPFKSNKSYYLSFMRTRNNYFTQDSGNFLNCAIMTIDGNKFNNNFKSVPVDYWQSGPQKSESEDRIITNKPYVENAMSYITHVDFYLKYPYTNLNFPEVANMLKQNGITFNVYSDLSACLLGNKNKRIEINYDKFNEQIRDNKKHYNEETIENLRNNLILLKLMLEGFLLGKNITKFEEALKNVPQNYKVLLDAIRFGEVTSDDFSIIRAALISTTRFKELKDDADSLVKFLRSYKIQSADDINRLRRWFILKSN